MDNPNYDIDRKSLADKVYCHIKGLILSAELRGGERIPEETIAKRFGISRTPVREALRRLDEYGLVKIKPRTYAEVVSLQPEEAIDVSRIRASIELLSAEILVEKGTDEDFDAIAKLAAECDLAIYSGDIGTTFEKDSLLHLEIAKRTGNSHLYDIMEKIDSKVQLLRIVLNLPPERVRYFVSQHQAIIQSLRNHDIDTARKLINGHIFDQLTYTVKA